MISLYYELTSLIKTFPDANRTVNVYLHPARFFLVRLAILRLEI
jgi:hypothetical protein